MLLPTSVAYFIMVPNLGVIRFLSLQIISFILQCMCRIRFLYIVSLNELYGSSRCSIQYSRIGVCGMLHANCCGALFLCKLPIDM